MATPAESQPQPSDGEAGRILAILAVGASLIVTARAIAKILKLPASSVALALSVVRYRGPTPTPSGGNSATAITMRANELYRAAYIANAARRIDARPDKKGATRQEVAYYRAHQEAAARRVVMANRVDTFKRRLRSPLLGWYAVGDSRTSAECKAADGRNFYFDRPPVIGYPGAVHPNCRCTPGPPHPRGRLVDGSSTVRNADTASKFEQRSI